MRYKFNLFHRLLPRSANLRNASRFQLYIHIYFHHRKFNAFPPSKGLCFGEYPSFIHHGHPIDLDLNRSLARHFPLLYSLYCIVEHRNQDNRGTRLANEYSISVLFRRNYFATLFNQLIILACINRFFRKRKLFPSKSYFPR